MFRAIISPADDHPGHQQAASSLHYTTSYKHSLVLLRMGEIIARNVLSWLKLLIKLLLLHLVGCLYYCISDARSHKYQVCEGVEVHFHKFFAFMWGTLTTLPTDSSGNSSLYPSGRRLGGPESRFGGKKIQLQLRIIV